MLNSVFGALAKLALLVMPVYRLSGWGKTKCAHAGWQNFKIFCAVGKKIKHRRVGKEYRLTRCPFILSFLCPCSSVKMVYFFCLYQSCRCCCVVQYACWKHFGLEDGL